MEPSKPSAATVHHCANEAYAQQLLIEASFGDTATPASCNSAAGRCLLTDILDLGILLFFQRSSVIVVQTRHQITTAVAHTKSVSLRRIARESGWVLTVQYISVK